MQMEKRQMKRKVQVFKSETNPNYPEWLKTKPRDIHSRPPYCILVKDYTGTFHEWGVKYEEFDNGPGNYTVAIVERDDGVIVTPDADRVKFL